MKLFKRNEKLFLGSRCEINISFLLYVRKLNEILADYMQNEDREWTTFKHGKYNI